MYDKDDQIEGVQWIMPGNYLPIKHFKQSEFCSKTNLASSGYRLYFSDSPERPDALLVCSRLTKTFCDLASIKLPYNKINEILNSQIRVILNMVPFDVKFASTADKTPGKSL